MTSRRAAALAAVLLATTLSTAVVVGGAYAARTLAARARLGRTGSDLEVPVERRLIEIIANWDTLARGSIPIGSTVVDPTTTESHAAVVSWVTRLNIQTYWLVAEARSLAEVGMRRRTSVLVRSDSAGVLPVAGGAWTRLP